MSTLECQVTPASAPADPLLPRWFRVARVRRETKDTVTLELADNGGATSVRFAPGQFNMLYAHGVGEVPISISGDPADTERVVHTVRAVGAVSRTLWGLSRGDVVGLRGPFGSSWPVEAAQGRDVVIVAGGIGLAPLRPVLYHVLSRRDAYPRVFLMYGARTPDDLLYDDEFLPPNAPAGLEADVTVDRAAAGWKGRIGVVTTLIPGADFDPQRAIAMVCGPEVMMRFTVKALADRGVTPDRTYVSMERNMKCAVGFCGHCQYGPAFVCKDGPVFRYDAMLPWIGIREL